MSGEEEKTIMGGLMKLRFLRHQSIISDLKLIWNKISSAG